MTFTNDDKERIFAATRRKLDEIFDDERRIIKKLVWSLYEDYGLSPKLLRSVFQSVILDIEACEARYEAELDKSRETEHGS